MPFDVIRRLRIDDPEAGPAHVAMVFWALSALAVLLASIAEPWPGRAVAVPVAAAVAGGVVAGIRRAGRVRFHPHLDAALGTVMITVLEIARPAQHGGFWILYVWVGIYVGAFFSFRAVVAHVGAVAFAYAFALALEGDKVADPLTAWLLLTLTVATVAALMHALVGGLKALSLHDPLTQLPNRRMWQERVDEELRRAQRSGLPVSMGVLDLDGFKAVNDERGHDAGDELLRSVSAAWRGTIRESGDLLARLGGDEFGLLLPGGGPAAFEEVTDRLRRAAPADAPYSVGWATWDGTETADALFARADRLMYAAKDRKRASRVPDRVNVVGGYPSPTVAGA